MKKPLRITLALTLTFALGALTACSSKPETADIQKELAEAYACPILELSDVKKVDGAANGKFYDAGFTHTISIKGGADAAAKLFAEWSHLAGQQLPAKMALEQAQATGNVTTIQQAEQRLNAIDARLVQIMPCETMEAVTRLQIMRAKADEAMKSGGNTAPVPVSIKVRGQGRMVKAESGWRFTGMPAFSTVEIVRSEPVAYPQFKVAAAEPVATMATASAGTAPAPASTSTPPAAHGQADPSFDCAKANTAVEKMICTAPPLAALDAAMAASYQARLASIPQGQRPAFQQQQAHWRRNVRDVCTTEACLKAAYQKRLEELK